MTAKLSRGRALITILILLAMLYFVVGGLLVWLGWLDVPTYGLVGGIAGSVASILGLVSLSRPSITHLDVKNLEIESLKTIKEATEDIEKLQETRFKEAERLERTRALTVEEINALKKTKEDMQLLVRKASLSLFLQEQRRLYETRILEEMSKHKQIATNLRELRSIDEKLKVLDEEIESDPNVALLKTIIESAKESSDAFDRFIADLPPLTRGLALILRQIGRSFLTIGSYSKG